MKRLAFLISGGAALLLVLLIIAASGPARVASAYVAKTLCSEVFLAQRDETQVRETEFVDISPALDYVAATVDRDKREARASLLGLGGAHAVYRQGFGCTIAVGDLAPVPPRAANAEVAAPFPEARDAAVETIIAEAMGDASRGHRALLVIQDGAVRGEAYADGFGAEVPFLSWSMAKSVTATLIGAAVEQGLLSIDAPIEAPEWRDGARAALTFDDLLRMQSGLHFGENYADANSDVNRMLFRAREAAHVGADQKIAHAPGTRFAYSSGTTNILARALRHALEREGRDVYDFPYSALFAPIGAASAVMEIDSAGNLIGSSYVYMTARDWARLGQLYLDNGVANGRRILPADWPSYVAAPSSAANGQYGAHFWLNRGGVERTRFLPGLPEDVYYMSGHEGQYVIIIPDRNAVIVRTGITRGALPIDVMAPLAASLYAALPPAQFQDRR